MYTITATRHVFRRSRSALNPLRWIVAALATHRQRLHLEDLDAHLLDDIGIDSTIARTEVGRPFWDLPR